MQSVWRQKRPPGRSSRQQLWRYYPQFLHAVGDDVAAPDAAILLSLPGVGTQVLATLLAEGSNAVRRRDYSALRCLCGVAPVTKRSGRSLFVQRRLAAHGRLRDAVSTGLVSSSSILLATASTGRCALPATVTAALSARLPTRLLNVACAMLRDGSCFDPDRAEVTAT